MNTLVLGRHSLIADVSSSDPALAALSDVVQVNRPRRSDESVTAYLGYLLTCVDAAERLVVTDGWDGDTSLVGVALAVHAAGVPVVEIVEGRIRDLGQDDIAAALLPGAGVIAPDSDESELPHEEAARIVLGPRGAFYDSPRRNFARIGLIWSGLLGNKLRDGELITARDVALMMVGVKLSRESFRHKRDNIVDGHGYLMTLQMIVDEDDRDADAS